MMNLIYHFKKLMMDNAIITKHGLDFEVADYDLDPQLKLYRIGTVMGQWGCTWDSYFILSFINDQPGNGHLDDVFEWFEFSCKRDGKNLIILEFWNKEFLIHVLTKRGFIALPPRHAIKVFNKEKYGILKKKGNEMLSVEGRDLVTS